eukprot:7073061-Pyramimonas_sp.AAC.1
MHVNRYVHTDAHTYTSTIARTSRALNLPWDQMDSASEGPCRDGRIRGLEARALVSEVALRI